LKKTVPFNVVMEYVQTVKGLRIWRSRPNRYVGGVQLKKSWMEKHAIVMVAVNSGYFSGILIV